MITLISLEPSVTVQSYYDIIHSIPCAVHYIPVTYSMMGSLYLSVPVTFITHHPAPLFSSNHVVLFFGMSLEVLFLYAWKRPNQRWKSQKSSLPE